jgi:hypothetical protein
MKKYISLLKTFVLRFCLSAIGVVALILIHELISDYQSHHDHHDYGNSGFSWTGDFGPPIEDHGR